jgi:hypothetical protein
VLAGLGGASGPNNALEPTPIAFARASLWLLARLTASVRLQLCKHAEQVLQSAERPRLEERQPKAESIT